MNVSFYLDTNPPDKNGQVAIGALLCSGSFKYRPSTGIKCKPEHFMDGSEEISSSDPEWKKKNKELNRHRAFLEGIDKVIESLSKEEIKKAYKQFKEPSRVFEESVKKGFFEYYDEWVKWYSKQISSVRPGQTISESTIKQCRNTMKLLQKFELEEVYPLNLQSITREFGEKFRYYIVIKLGQDTDTHAKHVKNIKLFCKWWQEKEPTLKNDFRNFKQHEQQDDSEPLTPEELLEWHNQCFLDPVLEKVRIISMLMCSTCVHVSDYNETLPVALNNIKVEDGHKFAVLRRKKNERPCIIPYSDDLYFRPEYYYNLAIERYGELPKMAGTNINYYYPYIQMELGQRRIEITTKTWRKTHCSIKKFTYKLESRFIMKTSGHKTERAFNAYLGIRKSDVVKELLAGAIY